MNYEIVSIKKLIPLEKVFPSHFKNLEKMINQDGFILKPIIADINTGIVLDGSHRYVYFLKNGFKTVPVYWVNYNDENIRVGTKLGERFFIDEHCGISKLSCKTRALSGDLFPPRTTRHFFPFRKADITLPLSYLERGEKEDVSSLIADVDINEEIKNNETYIHEINEEVEIIANYLSEVFQTKKYLNDQITFMKNSRQIAFFPGKFHPPHIGHILTILNILPKYKKLIIGVTEDIPENKVINCEGIINTLNLFFKSFNNVEITLIKGTLTKKTNLDGLPEFDILLSGNEEVLKWAENYKLKSCYVPRSDGFLCSGNEIRFLLCGDIE
jgi:nicotinamide mononucleotide adenylyltransferase